MTREIHKSEVAWCTPDARPGEFAKLRVKDLAPTQFAVGRGEVEVRTRRMRKKHEADPNKLHDYLCVRPVPVIVRGERFHLVDHHHLVRALHDALHEEVGDDLCVLVEALWNASSLQEVYFWKSMHARNWVYLFDQEGGGPRPPKTLPTHVKDLQFDPYRSLAWIVREHHGYLKNAVPFSEFKWANFFRTRILLEQDILAGKHSFDEFAFVVDEHGTLALSSDGKEIVDEAMFLAASAEARGLPGFRGSSI